VPYSYSYLFAYPIDLPPGTKSVKLPANENIRIFALSVSDEGPLVRPTQPLYDVLPSPIAAILIFFLRAHRRR